MQIRLKQHWFNIKNSLWFLPSVMAITSAAIAFALVELDSVIKYDDLPIKWFVYGGQRDGARSVLSTIASSMVTIAGVTFSITLVALTMASGQFGPRLLRNFIADKGNQFVIGTFISTFIYSLIVLLAIRGSEDDEFIPKISVVFAFLLAVFSLGVIIYFIHHVTTSIQADYVIKASYNDFKKLADEYLLEDGDSKKEISQAGAIEKVQAEYKFSANACFHVSGYIQSVDYDGVCTWAEKNNGVVEWLRYPGLFATINQPFAVIHHTSPLINDAEKQLRKFFVVDYQRTPNQDILYSLKQIAEVGVRALSPGINDPNTAITCIHWLGAALSELSQKKFDSCVFTDEGGATRVVAHQVSYQAIVDTCFDHLVIYAKTNLFVTAEIFTAINKGLFFAKNEALKRVLQEKAATIYKETRTQHADGLLVTIETVYREIMQPL